MLLRKYLEGGKVLSIAQHGLQRIFSITVGKKMGSYQLFIELFDEGNVVLCDAEGKIVKPLWHHRFREREVVPGATYTLPGKDCSDLSPESLGDLLRASDRGDREGPCRRLHARGPVRGRGMCNGRDQEGDPDRNRGPGDWCTRPLPASSNG